MTVEELFNEFSKFESPIFKGYKDVVLVDIFNLEVKLGLKLPSDFKRFLMISNGALIDCQYLYGIKNEEPAEDLFDNYIFETKEAGNPMPAYYLPMYPDGMGNHNCLDLKSLSQDGEKCNVIFWQHDRLYSDNDQPDIDANSFTQFLENLLKELTENYNYDGTEK